ncbi:hypothetical protein EVAR_66102_1 [Eumeta japonica]|uniref:Uncharacterized protein n=1 Tax=Eumeta variegata TaxID=151549 RepID=A0A4C1ZVM4_EUMVA|nr:hypothetical protein EVAR_66102_1 [Eumeta japonica]
MLLLLYRLTWATLHYDMSMYLALKKGRFVQQTGPIRCRVTFIAPEIKYQLKKQQFSSPMDARSAFERAVEEISNADWIICSENLLRHMKLCIEADEQFFDKMQYIQ